MPRPLAPLLGVAVALQGCMSAPMVDNARQSDAWTQDTSAEVDILWVIDDSTSMADEQERLAEGASAFVEPLDTFPTDFRLGVITTSLDDTASAPLQGDPAFLAPADGGPEEVAALLADRMRVGTSGSDKERGLEAALAALSPDRTSTSDESAFLRDEARLLVVFVSDEDDCSDDGLLDDLPPTACTSEADRLVPVNTWLADLVAVEGQRYRVRVGAIVAPTEPTCEGVYPGLRYLEAAAASGGPVGDLCQQDWSDTLSAVGLAAAGIHTRFQLSRAALPETLSVSILTLDGQEIPVSADPEEGWTYDTATWTLELHGTAIPPRGATIDASYEIDPDRSVPIPDSGS